MSYKLRVQFQNSFKEIFLTGENNRRVEYSLEKELSGLTGDLSLSLEVWKDQWTLLENEGIAFYSSPEKRVKKIAVNEEKRVYCREKRSGINFAILIEKNKEDSTYFDKYQLLQTPVSIGSKQHNIIRYNNQNLVSGEHTAIEKKQGNWIVRDQNSSNGTFVNGMIIKGEQVLNYGDTIDIIGLKIVYLGDLLAVNRPNNQLYVKGLEEYHESKCGGGEFQGHKAIQPYQRSPRRLISLDEKTVEIEPPPALRSNERPPLILTIGPAVTMVIPMTVGILFALWSIQQNQTGMASPFMFMGIITSITAAVIGSFWGYVNYRYSKKQEIKREARRGEKYKEYLERVKDEVLGKHIKNKSALEELYPSPDVCMGFIDFKENRLWERNIHHDDFLSVRLGVGSMKSPSQVTAPKEQFTLIEDELAKEPRRISTNFEWLKKVPITYSLKEEALTGVIGETQHRCNEISQIIALNLATGHSHTDVKMVFLFNTNDREDYDFARWLPHVWSSEGHLRMVADDRIGAGEIFFHLSEVLRVRMEESEEIKGRVRNLPHYVIFIADPQLVEEEPIAKHLLDPKPEMGISTVLLYKDLSQLPNRCVSIIQDDSTYSGYYNLEKGKEETKDLIFDEVSAEALNRFSRKLSGIRVKETESFGELPSRLSFLEMYKIKEISQIDVGKNWLRNRSYENMRAMIGYKGKDAPVYLDIHEKYHGPHGLVAGTTGSGKSETLQTYILSLAMNYHPSEVAFILIDYKGGGMAGSFKGLPHTAGIITNLSGNQTNRALTSINSEIKRRQKLLNRYGLKHIDGYIELYRAGKASDRMPHLLIIADEFAELKKEQEDFVKQLVSASRIGRSLGVHLILATQKPSGVVDDEIWSNSKFRLCLRVQDKQDSNEMIKRPDAAYINNPGKGFFQVGNDEIFEMFQSGWSGATYVPAENSDETGHDECNMINLWGKPWVIQSTEEHQEENGGSSAKTEMEVLVNHIGRAAKAEGIGHAKNLWLEPLPRVFYLNDLQRGEERKSLETRLGLVDDPENQTQYPLRLDLIERGNLLITGSAGSGKTRMLQTILFDVLTTYSPKEVNTYIIDFGSRSLNLFNRTAHSGGIIYDDQPDRIGKLLLVLKEILTERKKIFSEKGIGSYREYIKVWKDLPAILLVIDNMASFLEVSYEYEEVFTNFLREAGSYGISVVATVKGISDVRGRVLQHFQRGIGLQLSDQYEYEMAIGKKSAFTPETQIPGRGMIDLDRPLEFQGALAVEGETSMEENRMIMETLDVIDKEWNGNRARKIPEVPEDMRFEALIGRPEFRESLREDLKLPLGYDEKLGTVASINLQDLFAISVGGKKRSGKTNLLKYMMYLQKERGHRVILFDGERRENEIFAKNLGIEEYLTSKDELKTFIEEVLYREFARRNPIKGEILRGQKSKEAMYDTTEAIYFFIGNMESFIINISEIDKSYQDFLLEMMKRGEGHNIYLVAEVDHRSVEEVLEDKFELKNLVPKQNWIYLGGELGQQSTFKYDGRMRDEKKFSPGTGYLMSEGELRILVTPEAPEKGGIPQ